MMEITRDFGMHVANGLAVICYQDINQLSLIIPVHVAVQKKEGSERTNSSAAWYCDAVTGGNCTHARSVR
jgi:hypothetical protein